MSKVMLIGWLLLMGLVTAVDGRAQGAPAGPSPWPEKLYNSKPADGDLILPMPCGGAMVFRMVEVPSKNWLDDEMVELGQSDPHLGYKEGRRISHIAGAFTDPANPSRRFYYLAKYETTQDQFAAISADPCPTPTDQGRLPKVDVSWFDAVNFARRYSEWLLQKAADKLPREDKQPGFLRLPTEVEWEFAARGGEKVDKASFVAAVFPLQGDLARYVWHQGTQSAGGKLQPIGLLQPNPLGLHDVLGNAAEMVFVPFQLDRRGRQHGQAGGFVAKGGDIFTSRAQIRTAARDELPYFDADTGKAKSLRSLGFRLVLTAPVIVSHQRLQSIQEEWTQLPEQAGDAATGTQRAMTTLSAVAGQASDAKLRTDLELVQRDLERAHTQINENRDRAIKALIRMGAFLGNKVRIDNVRLRSIDAAINQARQEVDQLRQAVQGKPAQEQQRILARAKASLNDMDANRQAVENGLQYALSYYGDMVIEVARDYNLPLLEPQLAVLLVEFQAKQSDYLSYYAKLFVAHIKAYKDAGAADTTKWLDEILKAGARP